MPKTAECVRAVVGLATNVDKREAADTFAARGKVKRRYVHKVLQELLQAGLVT